jgi:alpha-N-arabinofuranosidase
MAPSEAPTHMTLQILRAAHRIGRTVARALVASAVFSVVAVAQSPTRLVLDAGQGRDTISRHIYGQFAEHLGRLIYDGIWTRRDSTEPWHMREDVVQALKRIKVPNIRWPGGCFADYYHWRDGVGPREQRPSLVNNNWGGVTEDNGVGTHEFLALGKALGAEPYVVGNIGSGTVQEMHDWWEYLNHPGKSPMADLRRRNGQDAPFDVRLWGLTTRSPAPGRRKGRRRSSPKRNGCGRCGTRSPSTV